MMMIIIISTIKITMKLQQAVMLVSLRCSPFKSCGLSYCPAVSPSTHHDRQFHNLISQLISHDHIQTDAKLTILNLLEKSGCHETRRFTTTSSRKFTHLTSFIFFRPAQTISPRLNLILNVLSYSHKFAGMRALRSSRR